MRIGILTYHAAYNFGANLQALSTFSYLKNTGHEPVIIDFSPKELEEAFDKTVPAIQANVFRAFLHDHFTMTDRCRNSVEVAKEIDHFGIEAVIIGSDAVIQHFSLLSRIRLIPSRKKILVIRLDKIKYETNFPNPFWGEFEQYLNRKIPVAMMSVSCQNTDYKLFSRSEKKCMSEMIGNIGYISVRDKRSKELIIHITRGRIDPDISPDPVFAFNDNYKALPGKSEIEDKFKLPAKYILLSFNSSKTVSREWISVFEDEAAKNGFACVALSMPGGINFENGLKHKVDLPVDPIDWYSIIKYSEGYVGEKMHPLIVCLHNAVPFFSFDHYGILKLKMFLNQNSSKIFHILSMAGYLKNRVSIAKRFRYQAPDPVKVFNSLSTFDREKSTKFSRSMSENYVKMMSQLTDNLSSCK